MRATNESLWNSWKANLLEDLYYSTKRAFRRGLEKPVDLRAKIRENQQQAIEILKVESLDQERLKQLWKEFKADYFLRYSPEQIAWHSKHILSHNKVKPLVIISPKPYRGGTEVFVYTKDKPNIFFNIVSLLGAKKLSIHDAKITTNKSGFTANTFVVLDNRNKAINDSARALTIARSLSVKLASKEIRIKPKPLAKRFRQFKVPTHVSFIDGTAKNRTILEIVALDHPGLLANIATIFQKCNIQIHSAKITTFGEKAEDVFTISNNDNKILTTEQKNVLEAMLCADSHR
jgi:[protein-PII] uridylyltransferase